MKLKERVIELASEQHQATIGHRRHLHMFPELSFQEKETSAYIAKALSGLDIPFTTGWAEHGIVAHIEGHKPHAKVVALRADMDALPIQEENDVDYASRNQGVMHACGHDVHSASLMGVAAILVRLKSTFDGTVKLIFQPGEERMPGGASIMLREGALKDPEPNEVLGQHVYPLLPAGKVGFKPGQFMASADEITLRVVGRGGHGAVPQFTIDPVVIAAQIVTGIQTVISRVSDPTMPSVLTFGRIESEGGTFNVIPNAVHMLGTFRTFDEVWRKRAHEKIHQIAQGIAESHGATCEVQITVGYPALYNHAALTARCRAAAIELIGEEHVEELPLRLTAEDFAYYTREYQGCFYRLGVSNHERNITSPVHTPTFNIDERALFTGPAVMTWLALAELSAG